MFRTQRGLGYSVSSRPTIGVPEDLDTGLDWSAADTIDVIAGGVKVLTLTSGATANHIDIADTALTTGTIIKVAHTTGVIADTGSILRLSSSSVDTGGATNGTILDIASTGQLAGTVVRLDNILTTGTAMTIVGTGIMTTTGNLLTLTANSATTAAGLLRVNGNGLTSGIGAVIASSATAITGAGRLLRVDHTGATTTSGIIAEIASAANDETVIFKVTASAALAAGVVVDLSAAALQTGKVIDISDLDAITTGKAIHVDATGVTQTSGILVHLDSAATALTGAGRIFLSDHTGATTTSGILNEFASAANDESVIVKITASSLLAAGKMLHLSAATMTTGKAIDLPDLDGLTTGQAINIASNSADTGTRALVKINNDNTAATGATPLEINNDATAGAHIKLTGTGILGIDFTALGATDFLWDCTAASGCTAAPQTNAAVGFITCKVGGTQQWIPYYNAT